MLLDLRLIRNPCFAILLGAATVATNAAPLTRALVTPGAAKAEKTVPPSNVPIPERRAGLQQALDEAEQAIEAKNSGHSPVPAGATPEQISELDWLLGRFPLILQAQIDLLREIESARVTRAAAEKELADWKGPELPGPYSLTQLDIALDQLDAERTRSHSFESVAALQKEEFQRGEERLKSAQAAERLAVEKSSGEATATVELAKLRTRRVSVVLNLLQLQGELNDELLRAAKVRSELYAKRAAALAANYRFTAPELDRVLNALQAQQAALERRIEETSEARGRAVIDRDMTQRALAAQPPGKSVDDVRRQELQAKLEAANATLDALRTQSSALTTLRGLVPLSMEAWRQRYTALGDPKPEARQEAEKALVATLSRVDTLKSYANDLGTLADTAVQNQRRRLEALDENAPGRRYEVVALEATRRAGDAVNEVQALAQKLVVAQDRWRKEYAAASGQRPVSERILEAWVAIKTYARAFWSLELFAVEDTITVEGKQVTLSRGVTVGKSAGALLIFIVGYRLMSLIASRAQRLMVERFKVEIGQARQLRRWLMALTGLVLFVITLNLARIPLTVFAFAGGALAIGIGFGTQTLLRNLISGIIMLFERKVRVGDIVDVEGVLGTVTAVDIRSTTVQQFDGIETMVPNSLLLENKVTNWTGENPTMRRVVKVGVAYGSPTRQVADVMKSAADEHGLVLKNPTPYVIFEDFGDNALVFALYFWVDLAKANGMQVMSDLRFMLEKRFAEAGIAVAYPQRDVHLDAAHPLRVEVVSTAPPNAST